MLILALDTTTRAGSVALLRDGTVLEEVASDPRIPQAARLPGDLMALLDRCGIVPADLGAFAVARGPGSFTGTRVGIATMQGLAFAHGKPLFGISALNALYAGSQAAARGGSVAAWIDAQRGEVYSARFDVNGGDPGEYVFGDAPEPIVATPERILDEWARPAPARTIAFVGDGAEHYRHVIGALLGDRAEVLPTPLLAGAVGRLAFSRARHGQAPLPHAIRPLYVRRPDAELARDRRT